MFWVAKLLTTGVGESASDFMFLGGHWITPIVAAVTVVGAFVWQFRTSHHRSHQTLAPAMIRRTEPSGADPRTTPSAVPALPAPR
ncbi:hypothetical protein [Streptomyces sp. NPDC050528]|uniref:hypothetical protein n=1 Tax=unclassified Streptomyces TaxID=2593676 RepID=UPI0037A4B009